MSTFRYKAAKQKKSTTFKDGTLDIKHKEKMVTLEKEKKSLPSLKKELGKYNTQHTNIDKKDPKTLTTNDIAMKAQLKNNIIEVEAKIGSIENNYKELDYFFATSEILCDYYDIINDKNKKHTSKKTIMDFFTKKAPQQQTEEKTHKNRAELY